MAKPIPVRRARQLENKRIYEGRRQQECIYVRTVSNNYNGSRWSLMLLLNHLSKIVDANDLFLDGIQFPNNRSVTFSSSSLSKK